MNTTPRSRIAIAAVAAAAVVALGAGAAAMADDSPAADRPIPVEPDGGIGDTPGDTPGDEASPDVVRERARDVLGLDEDDLPDDVRVSRRGAEEFALTEDYVIGRMTVQLDDDGSGHRVTSVTVELPDGPETFEND